MSKAFTKDDRPDEPVVVRHRPSLPEGVPNYVSRRGLQGLRDLLATTEPGGRRAELERRIATAVLVPPPTNRDEIPIWRAGEAPRRSGAVRDIRIVGVDEAEPGKGLVAFLAPVGAGASLGRRTGDQVTVPAPGGSDEPGSAGGRLRRRLILRLRVWRRGPIIPGVFDCCRRDEPETCAVRWFGRFW